MYVGSTTDERSSQSPQSGTASSRFSKRFGKLIYAMNCKEEEMEKFHYPELLGTWGKTMDLVYGYNEVQYCCNT